MPEWLPAVLEWLPAVLILISLVVGMVVFFWRLNVGQNHAIAENGTKIEVHEARIVTVEDHLKKINGSVEGMAKHVAGLSIQMGRMETVQGQSREDLLLIKTHLLGESGKKMVGG